MRNHQMIENGQIAALFETLYKLIIGTDDV